MNSVTPLLSMIDSSTHPDKTAQTATLKPGGLLAADTLFNIHSEKKEKIGIPILAVPKKTEEKIDQPTSSSSSSSSSSASSTSAPSSSTAPPENATSQPAMPYNVHLAALMRQYEIISQGTSKSSPADAVPTKAKPAPPPKMEEKLTLPTADKPIVPIQHIFPPPVRNLATNSPLTTPISPLLNFAHPFAGYAWPMMPFANPFAPAFMQCYPYPPQLSLLQNQFTFQQPITPVSQQLAASSKKRKASPVDVSKPVKRVKEIEPTMVPMNFVMPQLQSFLPGPSTSGSK